MNTNCRLRNARLVLRMTTSEAAQVAGVTRKTWEKWEALEANGLCPPKRVELFFWKVNEMKKKENTEQSQMVVILGEDGNGLQYPIDVVCARNYIGYDEEKGDQITIKSLAVNSQGDPCVYRTKFDLQINQHVIEAINEWESVVA